MTLAVATLLAISVTVAPTNVSTKVASTGCNVTFCSWALKREDKPDCYKEMILKVLTIKELHTSVP